MSPFYDRECLNERSIQNAQLDLQQLLATANGVSFRIVGAQFPGAPFLNGELLADERLLDMSINPGLLVVDKVRRESGTEQLLGKYYIKDGSVFKAPDALSLISTHLRASMFHLRESLLEARQLFRWSVESGFTRARDSSDLDRQVAWEFRREAVAATRDELVYQFDLQHELLGEVFRQFGA